MKPITRHYLDDDHKYLCDKKAEIEIGKITILRKKVTCKECLDILKRKNENY